MENLFANMLNTSLIAGVMVLGVILARMALKKAPRFLICLLWAAVALRLILPFSVGDTVQSARTAEPAVIETQTVKADEPVKDKAPDTPVNNIQAVTPSAPIESGNAGLSQDAAELPAEGRAPVQSGAEEAPVTPAADNADQTTADGISARVMGYASAVWVIGMVCMALYALVGYIRLRIKTRVCSEKEKGVWLCDHISSSFIMGVFRPRIMIPSDIHPKEEEYVLLHERSHLARLDHIWKPVAYALLTVYWYNPLVWVAFFLFARDVEYACDERVIRQRGEAVKAPYANALINCAAAPVMTFAGPIAFGEKSVVSRVKNVLNYKKPAVWVVVAVLPVATVLTVCSMTAPVSGEDALIYVEPTETTETTEDKDAMEPTEATGGTEATSDTDGTEPSETINVTEVTENTEMTDNTEATENTEPSTEATEPSTEESSDEPTEPKPTEPEPTEPEPTEPEPTEPEPTYPSTVFSVSARSDILDGEGLNLPVTSFQRNKSFLDERMSFIDVPIMGAVVEGDTMRVGTSVATSLDELRYNLHETNSLTSPSEHLLINSSWLEKYDESYFEENAVIIIVDSFGSGICRHSITGAGYKDGELNFNIKKRSSEPGVPETGDITRWISIIEIPKTELENVITISFYVERMEPYTEHMY